MSTELTPADLADKVLAAMPSSTKPEWGQELKSVAEAHGFDGFIEQQLIDKLGAFVSQRKATLAKRDQAAKVKALGYNGAPLSPVLSVRSHGSTTNTLWIDVTPTQFIAAVLREQNVIDGRDRANKLRMQIARQMIEDDALMSLPDLRSVCIALDVDPDTLGLSELAA